jgi:uncharacterized membrane protein HdeD (DUF308 family)
VLVLLARVARVRRGWADAALGALMGMGDLIIFSNNNAPELGQLAVFAVAGGCAGIVFWLVAGRPRPPYRHLLLPG